MTPRYGTSGAGTSNDAVDGEEPGASKGRRSTIRVACNACRGKKIRCDGQRPRCGWCTSHPNASCIYDTGNSEETRSAAVKRENESLRTSLGRAENVIQQLVSLPENESLLLLKRLRDMQGLSADLPSGQKHAQYQQDMSESSPSVRAGPDGATAMDQARYTPRPGVSQGIPANATVNQPPNFGYDQNAAAGMGIGSRRLSRPGVITLPQGVQSGQPQNMSNFYGVDASYAPRP